jgi:hypothetical protein
MRRQVYFIVGLSLFIIPLFAQEYSQLQQYNYVYANLQDTNTVKRDGDKLIPLNKDIEDLFQKFNVTSFQYAFPKITNNIYLKKTVSIKCLCDAEELTRYLKEKASDFFYDVS